MMPSLVEGHASDDIAGTSVYPSLPPPAIHLVLRDHLPNPTNPDEPRQESRQLADYQAKIPPSSPVISPSTPISIPSPSTTDRDRVPTPVSGRGDRNGHGFPFSRTPSPLDQYFDTLSIPDPDWSPSRRRSSSSQRGRPGWSFKMHTEQMAARYTPTSPLSPKIGATHQPLSPQPTARRRTNHVRQSSRQVHAHLPRYHPANFQNELPPSSQSPGFAFHRAPPPIQVESPRLMRERQRELIERAKMSSKIAASSMGIKPDAPRLDPLGSPKGAVTPLELEAEDYFQVAGAGKVSPAASPGAKSDASSKDLEDIGGKKPKVIIGFGAHPSHQVNGVV